MAALAIVVMVTMAVSGWPPWIGDLAAHFVVQMLLASSVLLLMAIMLKRWLSAFMLVVCAGVCAWSAALPWRSDSLANATKSAGPPVRLLYANVNSRNSTPHTLIGEVARERPDIVVLVEPSASFQSVVDVLQADYPYSIVDLRENNDGLAIFSNRQAADGMLIALPNARGRVAALNVEVDEGVHVRIIAGHTHPPKSPLSGCQRDLELDDIAAVLSSQAEPVVFAGDLNTTMWAGSFCRFLSGSTLRDARAEQGILPTWPSVLPSVLRLPIDHVLHSDAVRTYDLRVSQSIGSDHLPMVFEFMLER